MEVILEFDFKLDKQQVINTLKSYCEIIADDEIGTLYDKLLPVLYERVQPAGMFSIGEKADDFTFNVIKDYRQLVYCIVTMGDKITEKVNEFFSYAKMKEGMVLDAMAASYLFEISSQLFEHIYAKAAEINIGLSRRIAPGDGEIPLWYQKNILDILDSKDFLGVYVNEDFMLTSLRSMAYVYGADKDKPLSKVDHDCSRCPNKDKCSMRNE
ncbi:5-methyltetrahydrofolate--homocysteine methyltransferase [Clostridium thailandense]|uniref:5-methyltetrahydrofolate--homocysteine methyltransferase n=1 Tax=Clostridium thailandense TaxID=2794346 RepID=UPI003989108D